MKDTKFRILLDIHEVRSQVTIPVKVGDVSCKIYITLVEGGKPYKIHENSFGVFTGKKGDDNYLFNNCVIENGVIRYDFTPQTVAASGILECEVRIYDEDGGVLTTPSFTIVVDERAVKDSDLASSNEFSFLDEIIVNEGQRIKNEEKRIAAFNNFGIDLEDDGEVINIVKTDIDGSQEKSTFLKYADVIPSVTATATGNAITIESANAPLQNLKLYGSTNQDGTPTPTEPKELKSVGDSGSFEVGVYGRNLFDITTLTPRNSSQGGKVTFEGDIANISSSNQSWAICNSEVIKVEKGKPYIFSFEITNYSVTTNAYIVFRSKNSAEYGNIVFTKNGNYAYMITPTEDTLTVGVCSNGTATYVNNTFTMSKTQLEQGTQATPYKPCNKQSLTMPYTLRGKDDITDYIDFSSGKYVKSTDIFTISKTSKKSFDSETTDYICYYVQTSPSGVLEHSKSLIANNLALNNTSCDIQFSYGATYIKIPKTSGLTTQAQCLDWLNSNDIVCLYQYATPIETPLTETELNAYRQLMTNSGTTTVLSECDVEMLYYVNRPNAQSIGRLHEQINKDYFKLTQAIIETGGN